VSEFLDIDIGAGSYAQAFRAKNGQYYCSNRALHADQKICAILPIPSSLEAHLTAMRKVHKGNAVRDIKKAQRLGYACSPFVVANHMPDVVSINCSKAVRQGRAMTAAYLRTLEERGGAPTVFTPYAPPVYSTDFWISVGVFENIPGYLQGEVAVDRRLWGYITLWRIGELMIYSQILGHGDRLKDGIMYFLHQYIVEMLTDQDNPLYSGARYIMYGPWVSGQRGLRMWKNRTLFQPYYLNLVCSASIE